MFANSSFVPASAFRSIVGGVAMNETVAHRVAQVARQEFEMILAREGRRPVQPSEDRAREEIDSRTCLRATL